MRRKGAISPHFRVKTQKDFGQTGPAEIEMDAGAVGGGGNIQGKGAWVDLWRSDDEGESFELVSTPVEVSRSGNPPTLTLLPDVRLTCNPPLVACG